MGWVTLLGAGRLSGAQSLDRTYGTPTPNPVGRRLTHHGRAVASSHLVSNKHQRWLPNSLDLAPRLTLAATFDWWRQLGTKETLSKLSLRRFCTSSRRCG